MPRCNNYSSLCWLHKISCGMHCWCRVDKHQVFFFLFSNCLVWHLTFVFSAMELLTAIMAEFLTGDPTLELRLFCETEISVASEQALRRQMCRLMDTRQQLWRSYRCRKMHDF